MTGKGELVSPKRIVVGMSGSTGAIYGIRLLEVLRTVPGIETHLVITKPAKQTIVLETDYTVEQVECLAHKVYRYHDIAAGISSGSSRFHKAIAVSGVRSAGLTTMPQPVASAGANFFASIASGKFHGVINPTTPAGRR